MKFQFWKKWFSDASENQREEFLPTEQVAQTSAAQITTPIPSPANWYLAANDRKNLRQVVFEVREKNWVESRFKTLVLAAKYGQLIMNNWITGLFRMDTQAGPFLLVRTDGFVEQVKKGDLRIGFSFFRMSAGGVFVIYVEPKPHISGTPYPFIEIVYGLDVEDNRRRMEDAFAKDSLEIVLADRSDFETTYMDTGERFFNPLAISDLTVPLPAELRQTLQREWNSLLGYHASVPAYARDYNKAANEMWNLMPLTESPLLRS